MRRSTRATSWGYASNGVSPTARLGPPEGLFKRGRRRRAHGVRRRPSRLGRAGSFSHRRLGRQVRQALSNIVAVLAQAGARPTDIVRMNWYLADKDEYNARLPEIGEAYRSIIGRHFPAMTALEVAGFVESGAKIEIEATAMLSE